MITLAELAMATGVVVTYLALFFLALAMALAGLYGADN
jgi:hypothetical protein